MTHLTMAMRDNILSLMEMPLNHLSALQWPEPAFRCDSYDLEGTRFVWHISTVSTEIIVGFRKASRT